MNSFVLTDEPWLPCETLDGRRVELGIRDALVRAHELRALSDPSPLVTASLHRLLLAVLHRCFGPEDVDAWKALYRAGRFSAEKIDEYLSPLRERFDLFHPTRPFYQVAGLPFEPDPPARLVFERSNYGAPVHVFEHRVEGFEDSLSPAAAARGLVALQAFAPGGLVRKRGEPPSASAAPLNRGAVVIVSGDTFFETLALNLLVYSPESGKPIAGKSGLNAKQRDCDLPAWEQPSPPKIERRKPHGWLDLLTWQSRRLQLVANERGRVVGVVYCVGVDLDDDGLLDPMVAWRRSEKRGFLPVGIDVERAAWRDADALFCAIEGQRDEEKEPPRTKSPHALKRLGTELWGIIPADRRFVVDLFGMRGDQARILLVRSERVPVRPKILSDPDLGAAIVEALALAEGASWALRDAVRALARAAIAPGERRPDERKDVAKLAEYLGAERVYWASLRQPFEEFLDILPSDDEKAQREFAQAIRDGAVRAFAGARSALGATARVLKGAAEAERSLWRGLTNVGKAARGEKKDAENGEEQAK